MSCRSGSRAVRVTSLCGPFTTITSIPAPTNPEFQVTLPSLPVSLAFGNSVTLQLRYTPTNSGADTSTLTIAGVPLVLRGSSQGGVNRQEALVPDKTDVLLVVDNSGTMSEKQAALAANPGALFGYAFDAGVDFHFGVTTTDNLVTSAGQLHRNSNEPTFLDRSTRPFVSLYAFNVSPGTAGSGTEAGLATGYKALTAPLTTGSNARFLRRDAWLSVLFVSDAADQSPLAPQVWVDAFLALKPRNAFTAHGLLPIVGPTPTCAHDGPLEVGRYTAVIQASGGRVEEICADVPGALQRMGPSLFGRRETWFVATPVDPSVAVTVSIDGSQVAAGPQTWSWDATAQAVRFVPPAAPRPGQRVVISSVPPCLP